MSAPPNLSEDPKGFNSTMFGTKRSISRALRMLGYPIRPDHEAPESTVITFQREYNRCSRRFGKWGEVEVHGRVDTETLNALEHALRWAKHRENQTGTPSARFWRALCTAHPPSCPSNEGRMYAQTEEEKVEPQESSFVEVMPNGSGKLRNLHTDDALRCNILDFERRGAVVFAVIDIPPQQGLPQGRSDQISCPCVFRR